MRIWCLARHLPVSERADHAAQIEADGWDGLVFPDNQNLWGDPFVAMAAAAAGTSRLQMCTGATNPGTRHPAVMASAVASVGALTGGRVSLGIARGDSALAHIGSAPVAVETFGRYVGLVRRYLHGDVVDFEEIAKWQPGPPVSVLGLARAPTGSRLHWLPEGLPPVPIMVYASGPRTIEVAARTADILMFGLGADEARLRWGIDRARTACREFGRDPSELRLGAAMSVGVSEDMSLARSLVANAVASSARFSSLHGRASGPVPERHQGVYQAILGSYDMTRHGEIGAQVAALTPEFIEDYAVVGSAGRCVERLVRLHEAGIGELLIATPRNDVDPVDSARAYGALVGDVLPALRQAITP